MNSCRVTIQECIGKVFLSGKANETDAERLFIDLFDLYPNDIGACAAFLLNYVILAPGECCYYGNGIPHMYLSGGKTLFVSRLK